ncbi:MAG: hypothetical protein ACK6CU_18285 [Deltaproteobacteria bacterium]
MFFVKRSAGAEVDRPSLAVRDQTGVCAFFGIHLGVDTRRWPELRSHESLPDDVLSRFAAGPVGGRFWSLMRFEGSRSAALSISAWGLVLTSLEAQGPRQDDPALLGAWWIDGNVATPDNGGVMQVTSDTFRSLVVGEDARTELRELGSALGLETLFSRTIGWNVLALARLKHT